MQTFIKRGELSFTTRPAVAARAWRRSVTKNWTRINLHELDVVDLQNQLTQLRREITALLPHRSSFGHFPFRIYQLPDFCAVIAGSSHHCAGWRRDWQRAGRFAAL